MKERISKLMKSLFEFQATPEIPRELIGEYNQRYPRQGDYIFMNMLLEDKITPEQFRPYLRKLGPSSSF